MKYIDFPNDEMAEVQYDQEDDFLDILPNTNVVLAAFITCYARLKLYSYLETLQRIVLYMDTNSVIYLQTDGVADVPTGNYLGDMTDELEKDFGVGSYITELVALGPKNYAYKVFSEKEKREVVGACKVRGITLNCRNTRNVNFNSYVDLVRETRAYKIVTNPHRIARHKTHGIITRSEKKNTPHGLQQTGENQ